MAYNVAVLTHSINSTDLTETEVSQISILKKLISKLYEYKRIQN